MVVREQEEDIGPGPRSGQGEEEVAAVHLNRYCSRECSREKSSSWKPCPWNTGRS
jgi:hypothetical protein